MKKSFLYILIVTILAALSIVFLLNYSNRSIRQKNGFNRNYLGSFAKLRSDIFLENEDYTFISITPNIIRFYKYRSPNEILQLSTDLRKIRKYNIAPNIKLSAFMGMNSVTDIESFSYILIGNSHKAYKVGNNGTGLDSINIDTISFGQSLTLSPNSFIITKRIKNKGLSRRNIVKVNWRGEAKHSFMPEKQIDGYFCTDGQFRYDELNKKLIYMFYYRGEFLCLDTNLKVSYKAKTIDTVKVARIFLQNKAGGMTVHSAPPRLVNKSACVNGDKVYILSNLKADNESDENFNRSEVIDVYNLRNGRYSYSFYIPLLRKHKLYDFSINNNILVATYKDAIGVYSIPI